VAGGDTRREERTRIEWRYEGRWKMDAGEVNWKDNILLTRQEYSVLMKNTEDYRLHRICTPNTPSDTETHITQT
jgi:hypothetical protein